MRLPFMSRATLRLTVAASVAVAVAGCGSDSPSGMPGMDHQTGSTAPATSAASSPGSTPAGPHNAVDVMFASMMIPHHQQAVEMSDLILAKDGIDSRVSALAQQIKAAQAPEIRTMSDWLAGWGQNPSPSMPGNHDMGGGMLTQAELDDLEKATGDRAARLFLSGMVQHHQGAIQMAEQEVANGQNPAAKRLARDIIETQRAEIATMNRLLE